MNCTTCEFAPDLIRTFPTPSLGSETSPVVDSRLVAFLFAGTVATTGCDAADSRSNKTTQSPAESRPKQATQSAAPISVADLTLAGFPVYADTATLLRILGQPRKRGTYEWPGAAESLPSWSYAGIGVSLTSSGEALIVSLVDSTHATPRGLRVGDPIARVRELYGAPRESSGLWIYDSPAKDGSALMMTFENGRVSSIWAGTVPGED